MSLAQLPLLICFVLFPISNQISLASNSELYRNWIDLAWVVLLLGAFFSCPFPRLPVRRVLAGVLISLGILVLVLFGMIGVWAGRAPAVTAGMELKPLLYL